MKNTTFIEKFLEVHLIATISNSCEGKKIICDYDSWLGSCNIYKKNCLHLHTNCYKKIHFSFFKEDSLNTNLV